MTLADLERMVTEARESGKQDTDEVRIYVSTTYETVEEDATNGEATESERVPLDDEGAGWFECVSCGATHMVSVGVYNKVKAETR